MRDLTLQLLVLVCDLLEGLRARKKSCPKRRRRRRKGRRLRDQILRTFRSSHSKKCESTCRARAFG
jgi:hypothetical protein